MEIKFACMVHCSFGCSHQNINKAKKKNMYVSEYVILMTNGFCQFKKLDLKKSREKNPDLHRVVHLYVGLAPYVGHL